MKIREGLTFDDVLLVPKHSEISSRSCVDLSVSIVKGQGQVFKFKTPIIPANMLTITGYDMAETMYKNGGLSIINRFMPIQDQFDCIERLQTRNNYDGVMDFVGVSLGIQHDDQDSLDQFLTTGVKIVCIDVAHGDSSRCIDMVRWISETYPELLLIAGNVATGGGARRLWEAGADVVKCGIGGGSLCTTRIETGNGIPQLTALMNVSGEKDFMSNKLGRKLYIIADGGIKNSGDCVKALTFADMVMVGNIFAGAVEAPGSSIEINGTTYKEYVGSSTHKTSHIEGVKALVPQKGHVVDILQRLHEGIRSGCSYQGCSNLIELKQDPQFIKITNAGLKESYPHDVMVKTNLF